jgi:hypothetical protein
MAEKRSFPSLPVAHWWGLRDRFTQSIPGTVSDNYLATTLKMQPKSARANVIPALISIGLIDEEGRTNLEMAKAWRDDEQYPSICKELKQKLYPQELLDSVPDPNADREAAERWFSHQTGLGAGAVRKMALFYAILAEANPSSEATGQKKAQAKAAVRTRTNPTPPPKKTTKEASCAAPQPDKEVAPKAKELESIPAVHFDIQVHISSDASPDQIDKIFESMAKHIYGRDKA